jgi:ubiquinone/menaquinone biosynthesis C-methylase UbiE
MQKAGAHTHGIDLNNHTIHLGRQQFSLASLNVCDAVNLHLFDDNTIHLIHMNQTAEHFRPDLIRFILKEFRRVLVPGGKIFTIHDTEELYVRQNRKVSTEDPTHICIKSRAWWNEKFAEMGLTDETTSHRLNLMDHPLTFLTKYDWDWWVLSKSMT